jgi:predicted dienelactone hydrolase
MSRKRIAWIVLPILIGLSALFGSVAIPIPTGIASDMQNTSASYAEPGTYTVGTRTLLTDNETPLEITLWYPSLTPSQPVNHRYRLQMKMGNPFGAVTVATYAGSAAPEAPPDTAASPYPLVILSPGFGMGAASYGWLAEHLASYGFIVAAPEHTEHFDGELNGLWQAPATRPTDIITLMQYLEEETELGGTLENLVDMERVAVAGHSYGGYTTLATGGAQIDTLAFRQHCADAVASEHPAAWLCDEIIPHLTDMARLAGFDALPDGLWSRPVDDRIDALIPIAGDAYFFGPAGLSQVSVPVMAIGGTGDKDTPWEWGPQLTYEHVSSNQKILIGLHDAPHMTFTGPCEAIPLTLRLLSDEFCADGDWNNRYEAHAYVKHFTTAFLLTEFEADTEAAVALSIDNVDFPEITYAATGY